THMGPAAPCGLHRYESDAFGQEYKDNLFACQFNMRKVSRHVLVPDGSTFKTKDHDFLVSDNHDFHPTDVIEDADGSLLVVDTGGWYKLCCPTSQLVKPDVFGAIYRVRKKGMQRFDDPRNLQTNWEKLDGAALVKLLEHPRPVIRRRATELLVNRGDGAVLDLFRVNASASPDVRRGAVWASCRIDSRHARTFARIWLEDPDETVRQAAIHAAAL